MTVVVGYVPGAVGAAALAAGVEEARHRGLPLVVVNSTRADRLVDPRYSQGEDWRSTVARLEASGVAHDVRHFTSSTTPADDLLTVAEDVGASLLVIGVRRRTAIGKLILGSTAQTVLLQAECPVLAVKPG
ncbi:MAG TPA: universal stress protein [Nocardioides sp.]|nr:universal stress protein [Nocardioides sp.]